MDSFAIRNLQAFFKSNEEAIGLAQNAEQAALFSNVFLGTAPRDYEESFIQLKSFVDQSLDEVKPELNRVLFPVFVQLFLNMILKRFTEEALEFFAKYKKDFLPE
jgi:transcription initiation factor TFIID subunit 5